jgi:hypothetical protein
MKRLRVAVLLVCGVLWSASLGDMMLGAEQSGMELPAIETVEQDGRGGFLVNGKPFFPILLYSPPLDEPTLAVLREFEFNVVTCHAEGAHDLRRSGMYAALHGRKPIADLSSVFLMLGTDSPALYFKKDLLGQTREANAKVAAIAPNRPLANAIGYWENEPTGVYEGQLPSRAVYEELVQAIDVSAPYLYPVPYQPVASVGDAVARARAATNGKKAVLPILQLFAWKPDDRYPTPAELECMAFLALAEGAGGIGYYSYSSVTGKPKTTIAEAQPTLWQSVRALNHQLAEVAPRWRAAQPSRGYSIVGNDPAARLHAVVDASGALLVAINTAAEPRTVVIRAEEGPASGRFTIGENGAVPLVDRHATITLKPFGVVVLRRAAL